MGPFWTARCYFLLKSPTAPGGPKSTPIWSKIETKRLPGGVQMASKVVARKGVVLVSILNLIFMIFQTPRGARGPPMAFKIVFKTCSRREPFPDNEMHPRGVLWAPKLRSKSTPGMECRAPARLEKHTLCAQKQIGSSYGLLFDRCENEGRAWNA